MEEANSVKYWSCQLQLAKWRKPVNQAQVQNCLPTVIVRKQTLRMQKLYKKIGQNRLQPGNKSIENGKAK